MRDYLLAKTIPSDVILVEDAATTTEENLGLSLALLDPPTERVAAVTNNFHVFRTAMVARSPRLPVDVIVPRRLCRLPEPLTPGHLMRTAADTL